jgi:hypothetical protein
MKKKFLKAPKDMATSVFSAIPGSELPFEFY